ncbi:hypothetical protein [Tenggerimyces flavus]|uniref:Integral membrane protein n=1 Tax=Tenggerimyces flavus TaxID=1708749 RepID=A0ABV7YFA1_9ACTN|nr:hypothetical protein [Tenggerimyces flavus]MBM7784585.1 hypothetical protein [Tenggerimyces flavus]
MDSRDVVGVTLIAGLVIFMIGAVRWRLSYEHPDETSLPLMHTDKWRRAWIHIWMLVAAFVTPAGVAGIATLPGAGAFAAMAATVYAIGSAAWVVSLAFRLTIVPWAAERTATTGQIPETFPPFDAWAESLFVIQMAASYGAYALLGAAVLAGDLAPTWVGWLGVGWGVIFLVGFALTRSAGPFSPPFWAHTYTGLVGVVLLATAG